MHHKIIQSCRLNYVSVWYLIGIFVTLPPYSVSEISLYKTLARSLISLKLSPEITNSYDRTLFATSNSRVTFIWILICSAYLILYLNVGKVPAAMRKVSHHLKEWLYLLLLKHILRTFSSKSLRTFVWMSTERLCICFLEKYNITNRVAIIPV